MTQDNRAAVPCDTCGAICKGGTMHVMEDVRSNVIGRYCRDCCPRCETVK